MADFSPRRSPRQSSQPSVDRSTDFVWPARTVPGSGVTPSDQGTTSIEAARRSLEALKDQLLAAALDFADGRVDSSQLDALRKRYQLRQEELKRLERGDIQPDAVLPFVLDDKPPAIEAPSGPTVPAPPASPQPEEEARRAIADLDRKLALVEEEFRIGNLNVRQYEAIMRHYREQRDVASRMLVTHPSTDRWKVVLAEGKTTFLKSQLEARSIGYAIYDIRTQRRLFHVGNVAPEVEAALPLLSTFRPHGQRVSKREIFGTDLEDGRSVSLIVGQFTAALVIFSQRPPHWQLNVCNEVHVSFEGANKASLSRGDPDPGRLIFPDLRKLVKDK